LTFPGGSGVATVLLARSQVLLRSNQRGVEQVRAGQLARCSHPHSNGRCCVSVDRLTLTQAARALGVPQHRLIHLCEKHVVVPDLDEARGRGSSRGFSRHNLFEFAVALELRRLELPVRVIRAILQTVRSFEGSTRKRLPGFTLPESLIGPGALDVSVLIVEGTTLYFSVVGKDAQRRIVGGVDLPKGRTRSPKRAALPRKLSGTDARRVIESAKVRTEVNLTGIARDLPWPVT
jgi:DNA-binding transcriptional MerR regulator